MAASLHDLNYLHLYYFWMVAREGSMVAAAEQLQVTQPTISMQIRKLEQSLGQKLFDRVGRGLQLTQTGQLTFDYADEIFALGEALIGSLNGYREGRLSRLTVGVPNEMPKRITYRLLEPLMHEPERLRVVCHEADLSELLAGLAVHRFDVVLSDMPVAAGVRVKSFNHPIGDCGITFCGKKPLADRLRIGFPHSLDRAPLLLPTPNTEVRRSLDRWMHRLGITPNVLAEFDDSALMKEFGQGGWGVFPVSAAVAQEVEQQYGVSAVGTVNDVRVHYYAITTNRKLKNPWVVAIVESAKQGLLDEPH